MGVGGCGGGAYVLIPFQRVGWDAMLLGVLGEVFHELGEDGLELFQWCGHLEGVVVMTGDD